MEMVLVEKRRDGKIHPLGGHLSGVQWNRAVNYAHRFRCRDGLSYRKVQVALAELGIRRSLGQIHHDVRAFECARCKETTDGR